MLSETPFGVISPCLTLIINILKQVKALFQEKAVSVKQEQLSLSEDTESMFKDINKADNIIGNTGAHAPKPEKINVHLTKCPKNCPQDLNKWGKRIEWTRIFQERPNKPEGDKNGDLA